MTVVHGRDEGALQRALEGVPCGAAAAVLVRYRQHPRGYLRQPLGGSGEAELAWKRVRGEKPFVLRLGDGLGLKEPYFTPRHPLILQAAPERLEAFHRARRRLSQRRWQAFAGRSLVDYLAQFSPPPELLGGMTAGDWEVLEVDRDHGTAALLRCAGDYLVATPYGWLRPGPAQRRPTLAGLRASLGLERYHDPLVLERLSGV
ncbi:hypothetical protein [Calidithermus chliarophilus]|uniref:hypothetical protein n=1 Tax=Calidithermus chliarophilus TaxID=52023 RepID=UPI00041A1EB8|nr:hypothetical protein [Calidithermus chliarophilus]